LADEEERWEVEIEPVGRNPDSDEAAKKDPENMGGMVIWLKRGWTREEFSRVAFVRRVSKNPKRSFDEQLDEELKGAEAACAALNKYHLGSPGELK